MIETTTGDRLNSDIYRAHRLAIVSASISVFSAIPLEFWQFLGVVWGGTAFQMNNRLFLSTLQDFLQTSWFLKVS